MLVNTIFEYKASNRNQLFVARCSGVTLTKERGGLLLR